jgi:cytoskeletal protein CcmA (bactofilin family)
LPTAAKAHREKRRPNRLIVSIQEYTMKKWIVLFLTSVLLVFSLAAFAAESKYYSGESYVLKQGETVDGDLFVFSNSIRIEGSVAGEAFLMGSSVKVSGEIAGDAFVIGDNVDLSGHFVTDARVLGNTVDLTGTFDGEVSVAGRHVDIEATVAGVVNAAGETVSAAGTFANTVNLRARKVLLLPDAQFDKDVNVSAEEFSASSGVMIAGSLNKIIGREYAREKERKETGGFWVVLGFWLVTLCGIIIVGLIVRALFPDFVGKTTEMVYHHPLHNLGWGVLTLVLIPILLLILMVTLVGIPLALLALLAFIVGLYLGKLFVAIAAGGFVISRLSKKETPFWARLVVGAVLVYLVLAIPILGFFIAVLVYCLGIGAIVNLFVSSRKRPAAAVAAGKSGVVRTPVTRKPKK